MGQRRNGSQGRIGEQSTFRKFARRRLERGQTAWRIRAFDRFGIQFEAHLNARAQARSKCAAERDGSAIRFARFRREFAQVVATDAKKARQKYANGRDGSRLAAGSPRRRRLHRAILAGSVDEGHVFNTSSRVLICCPHAMQDMSAVTPELMEFFQKVPALLCVLDMENRMLQPNEAWTRVTGHPLDKLNGASVEDFTHPEDRDPARRTSRVSLEAQGAIVQESRFRCADGSYRWIEWTMRVVFERALVYCCARAVEQPRRATVTAARRLETYLRRAPVAMIEVSVDRGITEWSSGAEKMFGFTRAEALGKQLVDLVVPEQHRESVRQISKALREGKTEPGRAGIGLNMTKDGRLIHCEWHNALLADDEGKVRGILSIAVDRSELEEQRARAEESGARFDLLMRGARGGYWDYKPRDPKNPIELEAPLFVSEGLLKMLGLTTTNTLTKLGDFATILLPDDGDTVRGEFHAHIVERRQESYLEYRLAHADGSPVWVGATWYAQWDDDGGLIRFAGSYVDITERKIAEADQREKLALIERQALAIRELSTPILEVQEGVLCLPIVGVVDSGRAAEMMNLTLDAVVSGQARFLIIDLTGVPVLDTSTADRLIAIARAAGLVGAQTIITGLRPAVAQTVVTLGVGMGEVKTLRNLKDGLRYCLSAKKR